MRRNIKELLERVDVFNDSLELSEALRNIASDYEGKDQYFVKECSDHIEEMWGLLMNIKQELEKADGETKSVGKDAKKRFEADKDIAGQWFVFDNESCSCRAGPFSEEKAISLAIELNKNES